MSSGKPPYVCPVIFAATLDNFFRRMLHNQEMILKPYISRGMRVLDLGCGPGFFTSVLAKLAGEEGRVVAADIQQGMLDRMLAAVRKNGFEGRVEAHLCGSDSVGVPGKFDFILAFWMVHEVPSRERLFEELRTLINADGRILIVEPKFHVTGRAFRTMLSQVESAGLKIIDTPKVPLSRTVLLSV